MKGVSRMVIEVSGGENEVVERAYIVIKNSAARREPTELSHGAMKFINGCLPPDMPRFLPAKKRLRQRVRVALSLLAMALLGGAVTLLLTTLLGG